MIEIKPDSAVERSFGNLPEEAFAETERTQPFLRGAWSQSLKWSDLLKSSRILIVSQAGSGKTYECQQCQRKLWDEGQAAFFIELAELARTSIEELLSPQEERRFEQWRASQSSVAIFFLDSFDELNLTQGSFRTALTRLRKTIDGQLGRARIVITSRPIPIDRRLVAEILPVPDTPEPELTAQDFAEIAMNSKKEDKENKDAKPWLNVELLPLSSEQILQMAVAQGVADPDALLADIRRRNATEFAERPQDLIELCSDWRAHHRIGSHLEQVANDIAVKLKPRTDRQERSELSPDKALDGASRLALAAILTRRLTLRHSAESDISGSPGVALDPAEILYDWTLVEYGTLLERPLFGFASYGRVRFHHRSVIEYLAAKRLGHYLANGKPIAAVKRLLFVETAQGDAVVRPTMRPVAAWLALERDSIFADVLDRDPTVLLNFGDPDALTDSQKGQALSAYVERYGGGGWRGLHVPAIQVRRFATPALAEQIQRLWPMVENPEVRDLLLGLIATGKMSACAGIAFEIAVCSTAPKGSRLIALHALAEMADPRLEAVVRSLEVDVLSWPPEVARPAIVQLFPKHISVERLLLILARLSERQRTVGDLNYHLPRRIEEMQIDEAKLDALRRGLSDQVADGMVWVSDWPHYKSARPFLLPALAATCMRLLSKNCMTSNLAMSITLALRLTVHDHDHLNDEAKALRKQLATLDIPSREVLFWAEDRFRQSHHPVADPWGRMWASVHHGPINLTAEQDDGWIRAALTDPNRPVEDRAMLFYIALTILWREQCPRHEYIKRLRMDVADCLELVAMADEQLKPVEISAERSAQELKWEKERNAAERRRAKDHESWVRFWSEVADSPDVVFGPDRAKNTVWNLWRAMSRSGEESRESGWDRPFLERRFGKPVADRMREALRSVWRNDTPTLRSEREPDKRNTFSAWWQLGLAAIAAESENPQWATKLTAAEARLASRYAPIQLNGLPRWLDSLVQAYPTGVDSVLGEELDKELMATAQTECNSWLLQSISNGSQALVAFFRPRVRKWLEENGDSIGNSESEAAAINRLDRVLEVLQRDTDTETVHYLCEKALDRLNGGIGVWSAKVWLSVLMKLDPEAGTTVLERGLESGAQANDGPAVGWIAALFGDAHRLESISISRPNFTPQLLLRLIRLTYRHVRPEEDLIHVGAFSPTIRDDAQHARNALLSALLQASGPEGWAAKLQLAEEPYFAHMRDRVLAVARERAAQEVDDESMNASAVVTLERRGEAPPQTRDDMFQLINDRLDDLDDLLLQDVSPRESWALITDERVMRRVIALQLKLAANQAYNIDQEAVTADEKETDIRFRSTVGDQQGTIELKIGERPRSAKDLREALSKQLVRKYMAADSCRAGCLLITLAKPRTWTHPDNGERLDLSGLITVLNEHARRIMDDQGSTLRIVARGLELIPRLPSERAGTMARKSDRLAPRRAKRPKDKSAK
jgi:hypothetical protein